MSDPARTVTVTTGSRLHFGLSSPAPHWGGAGAMIDEPRTVVRATPGHGIDVHAPPHERERMRRVADLFLGDDPGVRMELLQSPPPHAGFGSGTQVAVATAAAVCRVLGKPFSEEDAARTGRGRRSRLGTAGFFRGGLLFDAGHGGEPVASVPAPDDWRAVVVTPDDGDAVAGSAEQAALDDLPPYPAALAARLRSLAETELPRAVREANPPAFTRLLGEYGTLVGRHFAPLQGGVFASAAIREWADRRIAAGLCPPVQSSWGPTACVVCGADDAERVADETRNVCGGGVRVVRFRNRRAEVRVA